MSIKARHLASLSLLLIAGCSNDLSLGADDAGRDSAAPGGGGAPGGGQTTTCDPLAPTPKSISWSSIIAGGRSTDGTIYAADQTADGVQRVFVSDASRTLVRQRVAGSGSGPGFYVFSVTDSSTPFVLEIDTSTATPRMGAVQGTLRDRKTFVIGQDGEELTVLPNATIAAMPARNLPGTIVAEYVATLPDGRLMLVTRPLDDWSYGDFRLFFGPPTAVAERQVASATRFLDGGTTTILFDLDGMQATAYFSVVLSDAAFAPGPATLTVGGVVTSLSRAETPPAAAAYLCFGAPTGTDGAARDAGASDATSGPDGTSCVTLASVADECPATWNAAIADQSTFCATEFPFFDTFLSSHSCKGSLRYTRYLFDAGPRSCLYDPANGKLVGYHAVDGKAMFEATSCGISQGDFDEQGCPGSTCATLAAGTTGAAPGPLATGVDPTALAAAVIPQVIAFIRATQPGSNADTIVLGRPWGEFEVHHGSRLVFLDSWRMLVFIDGSPFAVVNASRTGDGYKLTGIGSSQFVPTMVARESMATVSAALDRGRAGFLRCIGEGGDSLLAYEAAGDAGQVGVRVQSLSSYDSRFRDIDAGVAGVPEMGLGELDPLLPPE